MARFEIKKKGLEWVLIDDGLVGGKFPNKKAAEKFLSDMHIMEKKELFTMLRDVDYRLEDSPLLDTLEGQHLQGAISAFITKHQEGS